MADGDTEKPPAERVREFIERWHDRAEECVLFVLESDHGRSPVDRWETEKLDALDLYEEVERRALAHSNLLGGVHVYAVEARAADKPLAHELLRVSAEVSGQHMATEPANEAGLLSMMMRHQEVTQRVALTNAEKLLRAAQRVVDGSTKRASDAEARAMKLFDQVAESRTNDLRVQAELENAQAMSAVKKQVGEQVAALLPQVGSKLAGKAGLDGTRMALRGFLGTIRREQMSAILGALEPAQQTALLDLYQSMAPPEEDPKKEGKSEEKSGEGVH